MTTQMCQHNGIAIFTLSGKIVGAAVSELRNVLLPHIEETDAPRILLNFENVRMMDSSALSVLIEAHAAAKRRNGRIGAIQVGKHIKNLIVLNRLVHLFERFNDEAAAQAAFAD